MKTSVHAILFIAYFAFMAISCGISTENNGHNHDHDHHGHDHPEHTHEHVNQEEFVIGDSTDSTETHEHHDHDGHNPNH